MTNKTGIIRSASIEECVVSNRGRMDGLQVMLLAQIWSGSSGQVECVVTNPVLPLHLASSHPHDDFSIKVLGAWIVL